MILSICGEPKTFEQILAYLFRHYDLVMDFNQHALVGSTVRSYLSWMKDEGLLAAVIAEYQLVWMTV